MALNGIMITGRAFKISLLEGFLKVNVDPCFLCIYYYLWNNIQPEMINYID